MVYYIRRRCCRIYSYLGGGLEQPPESCGEWVLHEAPRAYPTSGELGCSQEMDFDRSCERQRCAQEYRRGARCKRICCLFINGKSGRRSRPSVVIIRENEGAAVKVASERNLLAVRGVKRRCLQRPPCWSPWQETTRSVCIAVRLAHAHSAEGTMQNLSGCIRKWCGLQPGGACCERMSPQARDATTACLGLLNSSAMFGPPTLSRCARKISMSHFMGIGAKSSFEYVGQSTTCSPQSL